jgi:hypothetical protein
MLCIAQIALTETCLLGGCKNGDALTGFFKADNPGFHPLTLDYGV